MHGGGWQFIIRDLQNFFFAFLPVETGGAHTATKLWKTTGFLLIEVQSNLWVTYQENTDWALCNKYLTFVNSQI